MEYINDMGCDEPETPQPYGLQEIAYHTGENLYIVKENVDALTVYLLGESKEQGITSSAKTDNNVRSQLTLNLNRSVELLKQVQSLLKEVQG